MANMIAVLSKHLSLAWLVYAPLHLTAVVLLAKEKEKYSGNLLLWPDAQLVASNARPQTLQRKVHPITTFEHQDRGEARNISVGAYNPFAHCHQDEIFKEQQRSDKLNEGIILLYYQLAIPPHNFNYAPM